jgi:hypothetical protein
MAVNMRSIFFLNVAPCSPIEFHRCFGGLYYLHLQGIWVNQAYSHRESDGKLSVLSYKIWTICLLRCEVLTAAKKYIVAFYVVFTPTLMIEAACSSENIGTVTRDFTMS